MKMTHNTTKQEVNVVAHFITRNYWEYYVIDKPDDQGIGFALVLGFEDEFGSYSKDEVEPHVVCHTEPEDLAEIMPAPNWTWS